MTFKVLDKVEFVGHDDDQCGEDLHGQIGFITRIDNANFNSTTGRNLDAVIYWPDCDDIDICSYFYRPGDLKVLESREYKVGDKVRCLRDFHFAKTGDIGTIMQMETDEDELHELAEDCDGECLLLNIKWDNSNIKYIPDNYSNWNPYKDLEPVNEVTAAKEDTPVVKKYYYSQGYNYKTVWELALEQEAKRNELEKG